MAGARAVGAVGHGWGGSYAGFAGRHSCVRVGTRCSPPAVRGGPVARGVRGRALSPIRLPSSLGLSGPAAHVLWAQVCGYGVQRCPRGPYSLCSSGAGTRGFAARVSVVRGVCGQALPLSRLSALWAGCPCPSSTLAVGAGVRVWGPSAVPLACMPCGGCAPRGWWGAAPGGDGLPPLRGASGDPAPVPQRAVWGWRKGVPRGSAFHRCEGRLRSGAPPPPTARPLSGLLGSATHVPAPEDGRPGEGQRLTPGAPHNGGRHPPRGRPSATPTASNAGPQGRTQWGRCWVHTPTSTAPGTHGLRNPGSPLQRTGGRGKDSA